MKENKLPYRKIKWGMMTPSGSKLKKKLDKELK